MITFIYNISDPEQGGVGRYSFEILKRAREDTKFNEINSYRLFGNNYKDKLIFILYKRKKYLIKNIEYLNDINHFFQVEMFFKLAPSRNIVTFHNPPPFKVHNSIYNIYRDFYSISASILFYKRYEEAITNADFIIANSEFTKEGIFECKGHRDNIYVIPLGVDKKFKIIKPFSNRNCTLGYVGSFAHHKRVGKLLKDWTENYTKLKRFKLKLWGWKGSEFNNLNAKYNGHNHIDFPGRLLDINAVATYNSFKAFLFPSKWENFGLPIIEAVACGTPVFIYEDAEITPEVKKYAFSIKSIGEIPEKLEELSEQELITMSEQVKKEFDWDKNYVKTKKLYSKI